MTKNRYRNEINPYDVKELAKYFDPYVFNSLGELTISGIEWIRLTISFWDISGFSALCNELRDKPSHVVSFLNEYFDEGAKIINGHKGILDKFIGDGIMAYFGNLTKFSASGPDDALTAAIKFRESFEKIKERYMGFWLKEHGKRIQINLKCGIHTGYAFFGLLETERRKQITAIGHTANFASRLEHIAVDDEIIVSDELKNITQDNFSFERKDLNEEIKSFKETTAVFKLMGIKNDRKTRLQLGTTNNSMEDATIYLNGTCPRCKKSTRPFGLILPACASCGFSIT